ncbi:MAG: hypothetical protein ACREXT_06555, partial [Gammaproteobacteria bacterium]
MAKQLKLSQPGDYPTFRDALRELMHQGRVVLGSRGAIVMPAARTARDGFIGIYRHNKRGFGFVVPTDPTTREDLYIPPGENAGAISGDTVRARITSKGQRDGRAIYTGAIVEIIERGNSRFVGSLAKHHGQWVVHPDGNAFTQPIL